MGSPVSFPILNLVNFAVTRFVMETAYRTYLPIAMAPIRVNGDDILFPLPPGAYSEWCHWVSAAGLRPSLGKNYAVRNFAMINSKMYSLPEDWDRETCTGRPTYIPHLNLGLVRGPSKPHNHQTLSEWIKGPENPWSPYNLGDNTVEALRGWDPDTDVYWRIHRACIAYARPLLDQLPPVSWWVSKDLGGLGLPGGDPEKIGEHHRRLATWFSASAHTKGHEERVRSQWRHMPIPFFTELAMENYEGLRDSLRVPWVRVDKGEVVRPTRDALSQTMMSYARLGLDSFESERDFLKGWYRSYWKWVKLAELLRGSLQPMSAEKAIAGLPWVWSRAPVVIS